MSWFGDVWDDLTGKTAGEQMAAASKDASNTNLGFQQNQLDYLKENAALPMEMRDKSLGQMGGLMGLEGFDQQAAMSTIQNNPLYQAGLSNINQQQGNAMDLMASQASATGGLRGGNYQRGLAETSFNSDRAKQNLLGNTYQQQMGNLGGMAGMNTGANQIANQMGNMGNIAGQGIMGAAQSNQNAQQAGMQNMMGLGQLGLGVGSLFFSDERLKENITRIGRKHGLPWYSWTWNEKGNNVGEYGESEGHLAGEVEAKYPDAVYVDENSGYKKVNYGVLNNG